MFVLRSGRQDSDTPTLILGMDVSHGSPGRSGLPSIAAVRPTYLFFLNFFFRNRFNSVKRYSCVCYTQVVGSRYWPSISKYGASVRTQSPKTEMIDTLYKPLPNGHDDGIIR